ncbi:MAG: polysaccharide biosynthesis tyrosine autokinase [Cyanobacteriota bacterium]|nr:polysaccharide biosynthesis tyrosine autokinase [Cyanobacteriota bacterium]
MTTTGAPFQPTSGGGPALPQLPPTPFPASPGDPSPLSPFASGENSQGGFSGLLRTIKRRQGIFLITSAVVSGIFALNTWRELKFSPVYAGDFILQIESAILDDQVLGAEGKIATVARSRAKANNIPALRAILRSPYVISPVAERMGLQTSQIVERLDIQPGENTTSVMKVSLWWTNAEQGRLILENVANEYVKFSTIQRQLGIQGGMKWLDAQAPEILAKVNLYENQLRKFRERNLVLDPTDNAAMIEMKRNELVNRVTQLQLEQVQLQNQIETVKSGKLTYTPSGAPSPIQQLGRQGTLVPQSSKPTSEVFQETIGSDDPASEYKKYDIELARARSVYRDDSPVVQSLLARRNSLAPVVKGLQLDALRDRLFQNAKQQDELNRQILMLNENFKNSPAKIKEFIALSQKLKSARENYASYMSAIENYKLEKARFVTPWQVISPPAFNGSPVSPNIRDNLLRALLFGLIAGVGAAVLRERTDNVFHTPMEAEKELQLPVLGLVPYLPLEPGLNISKSISNMSASERFAIKESLRSLFTTFRLLRADRDIKVVGVTSSTQGEGKSTAISIFARTLADLGLKVLVVDADMRLPTQAKYLGVSPGGDGFSTLLTDSKSALENVVVNVQENLDFVPSGPKPPDPAKLLNSARCQDVIQNIRNHPNYDIILFDSPPCLLLADPILLGEKLDGILFLVGLGKVSRRVTPQACRRIKATGVDVLGLICNQVSFPTNLNDYGYEYGYYYHYGNAYTDSYGKKKKNSYFSQAKNSYFSNHYSEPVPEYLVSQDDDKPINSNDSKQPSDKA